MLGEYKQIPQDLLILDFSYQRGLSRTMVDKIIKKFDESLVGTIAVAKRSNGTFAVIDGQHRLAALKAKNYNLVPCLVYPEMSPQKEAQMFADLNSCKQKNTALELFWASIRYGDKKHREILDVIEKAGFTVAKRAGDRKAIAAIGLVRKIEKQYGLDIFAKTLEFIAQTWPGNVAALTGQVLVGLAIFINRFGNNPNFSFDMAKKKFMPLSLDTTLAKARNQAQIYNSDVSQVIADILFEAYNKNLKHAKKLQLKINKSETE